jgi:hypothetical protein
MFVGVPTYTRLRLMLAIRYSLSNTLSTFTWAVQLCFELYVKIRFTSVRAPR